MSRQRLENLPRLSLVVLQACKRLYEGSSDHGIHDIEAHARAVEHAKAVSDALDKEKYDFISFLVASRDALTTLASPEGVMTLQLLALILERMANICRLPPLCQDFDCVVPSDEKSALMIDRWLRRTAELRLDDTIEVATTIMANKALRSASKKQGTRRSVVRASRLRGHSSRQCAGAPQEGLPITARARLSDMVDTVLIEKICADDAVHESGAPTPSRFVHFGESPKAFQMGTPTSVLEQGFGLSAVPSPVRCNNVDSDVIYRAAQAA